MNGAQPPKGSLRGVDMICTQRAAAWFHLILRFAPAVNAGVNPTVTAASENSFPPASLLLNTGWNGAVRFADHFDFQPAVKF